MHANQYGKSKVMTTKDQPGLPKQSGNFIKVLKVKSFRNLGALITDHGGSETEIRSRLAIAISALSKLRTIWKYKEIS